MLLFLTASRLFFTLRQSGAAIKITLKLQLVLLIRGTTHFLQLLLDFKRRFFQLLVAVLPFELERVGIAILIGSILVANIPLLLQLLVPLK